MKPVRSGVRRRRRDGGTGGGGPHGRDRRVIEERFADDPAGIVLTRVERPPVDVLEVLAHLLFDARLGGAQVLTSTRRPMRQGLGVPRKPLGADEQGGDDRKHEKLLDRHPEEHTPRLPPRGWLPIPLPRIG